MFKRTKVSAGVLLALGGVIGATSLPVVAQTTQSVEITGSRIKRVDAEGSLPITTITRAEIEASGSTTVAEFVRTLTFASAGNFRPQSGSSAQSFAAADLRGLGSSRTLVLIDGRRLPKAPNVGDAVDMNSVPLAAIERVEILTDGASAVYGSDAIGGVINFITRKDFEGVVISAGGTRPYSDGGDRNEFSALFGVTSNKGRILGGFAATSREMVFTRQRPWGTSPGTSTYGNNYQNEGGAHRDATGNQIFVPIDTNRDGLRDTFVPFNSPIAIPGGCGDPNFYISPARINPASPAEQAAGLTFAGLNYDVCRYNFNAVAADEASVSNKSLFLRGEFNISSDWSLYSNASVSKVNSFGRYAPVPGNVSIPAGSPNNPTTGTANEEAVYLWHRFAAGGNRDTNIENTITNALVGFQGKLGKSVDIDFGVNFTKSKYLEIGRGYVVDSIATEKIANGDYDIFNPAANPAQILQSFTAQTGRDGVWDQQEVYATATIPLMKLGGGTAQMVIGAEHRKETYQDLYDSLSEAGQILGSAGNSAGGDRKVTSLMAEALFPISKTLEAQIAGRFEKYSDYGNDFSPKASLRWKAMPNLVLRGSVGNGFRAPSLPILTAKTSFSAESVFDPVSCGILAGDPTDDCQVNTYIQANPLLKSEKSKQFSFGGAFEPTSWASIKADYWNLRITDVISYIGAQTLVDRSNGSDPLAIPAGLGVTRDSSGLITRIDAGYANEGTLQTAGIDLNLLMRFNLGSIGRLTQNYTWSHVVKYESDGTDVAGLAGLPKNRATLSHTLARGPLEFVWNMNFIDKQRRTEPSGAITIFPTYVTHDLQVSWSTPIKGSRLSFGVVNMADKLPKLIPYGGRNFNFNLYDSYGAQPYIKYVQKL